MFDGDLAKAEEMFEMDNDLGEHSTCDRHGKEGEEERRRRRRERGSSPGLSHNTRTPRELGVLGCLLPFSFAPHFVVRDCHS